MKESPIISCTPLSIIPVDSFGPSVTCIELVSVG
jgi:hypothetical protein